MRFLVLLLAFFQKSLRYLLRHLGAIEYKLRTDFGIIHDQNKSVLRSSNYSMVREENESYYREQYWHWISAELIQLPATQTFSIVDLGCGQGRFSKEFRTFFPHASIIGVDSSKLALQECAKYFKESRLTAPTLIENDIISYLKNQPTNSVDIALMIEVAFFFPEWKIALNEIARILKPKGRAFISFRPLYFYALLAVRHGTYGVLKQLRNSNSGELYVLGSSDVTLTWQTSGELRNIHYDLPELQLKNLIGIGVLSGIQNDPLDVFCIPSKKSDLDRKELMDMEKFLGPTHPDSGRYMLGIFEKNENTHQK